MKLIDKSQKCSSNFAKFEWYVYEKNQSYLNHGLTHFNWVKHVEGSTSEELEDLQ